MPQSALLSFLPLFSPELHRSGPVQRQASRFRWPIIHAAEDNSVAISQIQLRRPQQPVVV
jgi:hypothetical protein